MAAPVFWQHRGARGFEDGVGDLLVDGFKSNVASGPGMSGGPCYLTDERPGVSRTLNRPIGKDKVAFLVSHGFGGSDQINVEVAEVYLPTTGVAGSPRYLSGLHKLDQRLREKKVKGGLQGLIDAQCQ